MEQEEILLSGLQHFAFCRRQWALIHVEQQWAENVHTAEGDILHRRAHDETKTESRGDTLIVRGLRIRSQRLHVTGVCDVVEFYRSPEGVPLFGREGRWLPYPVEYKKGAPKSHDADELQLCGQAICLEEMLACDIPEGSLFYGEMRRRVRVTFNPALRERAEALLSEMRQLLEGGHTPAAVPTKSCHACSLKELCLPRLPKSLKVDVYIQQHLKEEVPCENS